MNNTIQGLLTVTFGVLVFSALGSAVWGQPVLEEPVDPARPAVIGAIELHPAMGGGGVFSAFGSARSASVAISFGADGTRHSVIQGAEQRAEFSEAADGGIVAKVSRRYSADRFEELGEKHPELLMHLQAFPARVTGAEIELAVTVTSTYEAASVDELRENHPEIHAIYERYSVARGAVGLGGVRMVPDAGGDAGAIIIREGITLELPSIPGLDAGGEVPGLDIETAPLEMPAAPEVARDGEVPPAEHPDARPLELPAVPGADAGGETPPGTDDGAGIEPPAVATPGAPATDQPATPPGEGTPATPPAPPAGTSDAPPRPPQRPDR